MHVIVASFIPMLLTQYPTEGLVSGHTISVCAFQFSNEGLCVPCACFSLYNFLKHRLRVKREAPCKGTRVGGNTQSTH